MNVYSQKFRTKDLVVEAIQFTRFNIAQVIEFTNGEADNFREEGDVYFCTVDTLEGKMTATEYDYIVKGVLGEHYPIKLEALALKYELIKE